EPCAPGFKGIKCDEYHCVPADYYRYGECVGPFVCSCNFGWQGKECNVTNCFENECSGNGVCSSTGDHCTCNKYWGGANCSLVDSAEIEVNANFHLVLEHNVDWKNNQQLLSV